MKNKKILIVSCVLIIGVAFLIGGILLSKESKEFKKHGVKTTAEIISIRKEPDVDVIVKYTVGANTYTGDINTYSALMYEGQTVEIYYLPQNPNKIVLADGIFITPIICFAISGVVLGVTAIVYLSIIIKNYKLFYYKKNGREVLATVIGFEINENTKVMGKHPVTLTIKDEFENIYCTKIYCKKGDDYFIRSKVKVYVDNYNVEKYAVDIKTLSSSDLEKSKNAD